MSWLGCPVLGLRQTSIADMRLVNCYSRSVLGPSSLPSQFTELFGMGVKRSRGRSLRQVLRSGLSLRISRASCLGSAIYWMANYKAYKEGLEDMPHRC